MAPPSPSNELTSPSKAKEKTPPASHQPSPIPETPPPPQSPSPPHRIRTTRQSLTAPSHQPTTPPRTTPRNAQTTRPAPPIMPRSKVPRKMTPAAAKRIARKEKEFRKSKLGKVLLGGGPKSHGKKATKVTTPVSNGEVLQLRMR